MIHDRNIQEVRSKDKAKQDGCIYTGKQRWRAALSLSLLLLRPVVTASSSINVVFLVFSLHFNNLSLLFLSPVNMVVKISPVREVGLKRGAYC